ncbi:ATP-dependent DNA helicase [Pacificimonas flava]|uniref:DinG family ATP-dependent helicase YoaA n=1 Tax=Pacificimonas flava TaxID=1234595 RepID=M2U6A3_9SPHN|nr:ATP-dependent DNA helicase [Pacificimonas flava]EMD83538.1 DinG family ATP-dependent helicase YoaA [Pacificimonas flava]MBB5278910.1 ATP-dependent DNA helicase DinG [Pacificimonas flava]
MAVPVPFLLPHPALAASLDGLWLAEAQGEPRRIERAEAIRLLASTPTIMVNVPLVAAKLGYPELGGLDLLELFAFVHPARFAVPTVAGLAAVCDLDLPIGGAAEADALRQIAGTLLARMAPDDGEKDGGTARTAPWAERAGAWSIAQALSRARWPWAAPVLAAMGGPPAGTERSIFTSLPKWEDAPPLAKTKTVRLEQDAVEERLTGLLGAGAETREGQRAYARAVTHAFDPRSVENAPNVVLAEAGTGIGKTLGYLAPASAWAAEAGGTVWLSTYTKALQRQLDAETARLYPDPEERKRRAVVRKGRENYLCLLNLEDAVQGSFGGRAAIYARLVERWARYSAGGDMIGGDLPGWLTGLFGRTAQAALTDRRGECVYAACPHYRRCFIERAARASQEADLVIANHALVMVNAARGKAEGRGLTRLVFDEGHHLFDAADTTFSLDLTGAEAIEMRRWIIGPEKKTKGRRRGLTARLGDLVAFEEEGALLLDEAVERARALPSDGWLKRVVDGAPHGPIEALLAEVRATVLARAKPNEAGYGLETEIAEPPAALVEAAARAQSAIEDMAVPLRRLAARLTKLMEAPPDWLDAPARARVEGALGGMDWRMSMLTGWGHLLARVGGPPHPDFVDWLMLSRVEGREYDMGILRHWLDPTKPLAEAVLSPAHGVVVTSATLRGRIADEAAEPDADWRVSEMRTGANHLPLPARRFQVDSPFDYAANTKILVVTDVKRGDAAQLAGAYRSLIEAAGGGTLGLFTAIARLKAVFARIHGPLAEARLPLYAQHVDPIDAGTLVDMFRADPRASLLGTDALRDGVDVPGDSLRLVVMEGVPWARPTVLHAARRAAFGGKAYDDLITGGKLAQAFGRLVRRASDRGVFVLLGAAVPTRLTQAFPAGAEVERVDLATAREIVAAQVGPDAHDRDKQPVSGSTGVAPPPPGP